MKRIRTWLARIILGKHGRIIDPGVTVWKGGDPIIKTQTSTWTNSE